MSYGLAVYNTLGVQILDVDGNCPRVIAEFVQAAGSSGTYDYTGQAEGTLYVASIPEVAYSGKYPNPHQATVSGYVVSVNAYSLGLSPAFVVQGPGWTTDSRIIVFTK